jgi:NAD(P)-dependent dehydrogenase (short-subunit alcohol dehydrogenase family)
MEILGKLAIVTGGSGGIGRATALAFAAKGAEAVVIADVDAPGGHDTAGLVQDSGTEAHYYPIDVTDVAQLAHFFAEVEHRYGPPDIVHNNAGIVSGYPAWPDTSLARLKQVIDINLTGVVLGTRLAVEHMRGRGGSIVNTGSVAAWESMPEDPVYSATKAGVLQFTRSCRRLARTLGVRINTVCPGVADTPILPKTGDGTTPAAWMRPVLDQVELIRPEQVAAAVVDLVEDDSKAGEYIVLENPRRNDHARLGEPRR